MDRFRNLASQSRRRQPQPQIPPPDERASEEQDTPQIGLDGATENINSSNYARRCREIMDLYRDLRDLGYLFFQLVGNSLTYLQPNSVYIPDSTYPVSLSSGVNRVSAHERFVTGWTFLITSTGGKSSLVEAVSCVSIWSCIVVVTSD